MNKRTYDQIWSLYKKGNSVEASIEAINSITIDRSEAIPWLVRFTKDYANEQIRHQAAAESTSVFNES